VKDKQGILHVPVEWNNTGSDVHSCESIFNIPREQISSIQFQAREYIPITFKNISLRPGGEREGEIQSSVTSPQSSGEKTPNSELIY
jgi:hypothetical protein